MGTNIVINKEIEEYINKHSLELNKVQNEIISLTSSVEVDDIPEPKQPAKVKKVKKRLIVVDKT